MFFNLWKDIYKISQCQRDTLKYKFVECTLLTIILIRIRSACTVIKNYHDPFLNALHSISVDVELFVVIITLSLMLN